MSSDELDQPEGEGYSLVMPFVVTDSHGGPYADEPFVAGYECGRIDARLAAIAAADGDGFSATVHAANVPQLDLLAMHHGFHATNAVVFEEAPMWVTWTCSRSAKDVPDGD